MSYIAVLHSIILLQPQQKCTFYKNIEAENLQKQKQFEARENNFFSNHDFWEKIKSKH